MTNRYNVHVPPGRYRVVYSTSPSGSFTDFSEPDDEAAWAHAERSAYGARIVQLARVQLMAGGDHVQILTRPETGQAPEPVTRTIRPGKSAILKPDAKGMAAPGVFIENDTDKTITVTVAIAIAPTQEQETAHG